MQKNNCMYCSVSRFSCTGKASHHSPAQGPKRSMRRLRVAASITFEYPYHRSLSGLEKFSDGLDSLAYPILFEEALPKGHGALDLASIGCSSPNSLRQTTCRKLLVWDRLRSCA